MKVNKITLFVCFGLTVLSGLLMVIIENFVPDQIDVSLYQSIISGIFTGFIVSLVVSIIGYWHERNIILEKTDDNLKNLYINMAVISNTIGSTLPEIHKATTMESLPFKMISGLSNLNIEFIENMDLGLFSPICKNGKLAKVYAELIEFKQTMYNIKNISANLYTLTLEFSVKDNNLKLAQMQGMSLGPNEYTSIDELKNLINIRTAKLHEYETGQMLALEKIAKSFYEYRDPKNSWEMIKADLMRQVEDIIKE